jgi:organic hydroperoxide reductase OsmC/OhrA
LPFFAAAYNRGMGTYTATISWAREGAPFTDMKYSRGHTWHFVGGITVPASSSPHVVRLPLSVEAAVDPEEALVAALSSCHMLTYLALAAKAGFVVDRYDDDAVGLMAKNAEGKKWVSQVTLRPKITFVGNAPSPEAHRELHERAHHECFIANSVKTDIRCELQAPA